MNLRAVKTCWGAATWKHGTPLSMGRLFWIRRAVYYVFHSE